MSSSHQEPRVIGVCLRLLSDSKPLGMKAVLHTGTICCLIAERIVRDTNLLALSELKSVEFTKNGKVIPTIETLGQLKMMIHAMDVENPQEQEVLFDVVADLPDESDSWLSDEVADRLGLPARSSAQ
jgi:hypothetical protein